MVRIERPGPAGPLKSGGAIKDVQARLYGQAGHVARGEGSQRARMASAPFPLSPSVFSFSFSPRRGEGIALQHDSGADPLGIRRPGVAGRGRTYDRPTLQGARSELPDAATSICNYCFCCSTARAERLGHNVLSRACMVSRELGVQASWRRLAARSVSHREVEGSCRYGRMG